MTKMKFEEAKLIYQYFESDYDSHTQIAAFGNEEAAIQFGVKNLMENKGKRINNQILYDLEIDVLYDSVESSCVVRDHIFWNQFEENMTRIEEEIARRYKEQSKDKKDD